LKRFFIAVTIVLFAGLVGAGLWYTSLNTVEFSDSRWLSRSFDDVRAISVQGRQGAYTLRLTDGGWKAQVPGTSWNINARVISENVVEYLSRIETLSPYRSIGGFDKGGPEEYGLDVPDFKVVIRFDAKPDEPVVIKLTSDSAGTAFGWNSDSPGLVYEFGSAVLTGLDQPVTNFLDTRVFDIDQDAICKVQLVQPFGSSWLVEKRKEGYFFTLPGYLKDKPASDSELKLYIHSLALLKAGSLLLEPVSTDKRVPSLTLRVWDDLKGEPATVDFYTVKDKPDVYLGKSTWLTVPFILDAQSVGQLVKSAFDVQGRSVLKLDIGRVARFIVNHGGTEYVVERKDAGWRVFGTKKDIPGIDMSLWRFTELQFEALPLNSLPASAVQLMYCKLVDSDGEKLTELTFYADPKLPQGQCWMKNGGQMYYPVSSRLLKDLQGLFPVQGSSLQ